MLNVFSKTKITNDILSSIWGIKTMVNIKEKTGEIINVSIIWDTRKKTHIGKFYPVPDPAKGISGRGITCFQDRRGEQIELEHRGIYKAQIKKILDRSLIVTYIEYIGYWD